MPAELLCGDDDDRLLKLTQSPRQYLLLTLYGHIKTAEQRTIIQQYGDWYIGCWWVGCYIWYSEEATGRGRSPPRSLLAVPKYVTVHPSTASVPITVLLYNGPLLCGFNVPIKG